MALTKIGATLGGSADVIQVTQSTHGLLVGRPVKMTASGYAHATADTAANAEAVGIVTVSDWNGSSGANTTFTLALSGRITTDGCVPNVTAGTVLFLQVSAGLLAATEPSSAGQISKPMAVVTVANSEMIMVQQRGEVLSTGGATIADGSIDNDAMADDAIDSDQYVDGSIDNIHLATGIDSVKLADGTVTNAELQYINSLSSNAQTQITAKAAVGSVTPSTQAFSDSAASGSSAEAARVDHKHAMMATPSGVPSGVIAYMAGACPSGWTEYTAARGRYVVGVPSGGTVAGTVGTALTNQENRAVGQHTHTFSGSALAAHNHTQDAHLHGRTSWSNSGNGSTYARGVSGNQSNVNSNNATATNQAASAGTPAGTNANSGSVAGTNAPYIQLTVCQKD
jgi:hypothetical protein